MNIPSRSTITHGLPWLDKLHKSAFDVATDVKLAMRYFQETGNTDGAFRRLNTALECYGYEYLRDRQGRVVCWYVNTGETYTPTVMLCHNRKTDNWTWRIMSWGDWIESQEKQGRRFL